MCLPGGEIILRAIHRLDRGEILETGRSVREMRIQMRSEEGLNFITDDKDPEMTLRAIKEVKRE